MQVAGHTDHLLKSKRENKGKAKQLECNYELIKHFYIYTHTQILSYGKYEQYHENSKF